MSAMLANERHTARPRPPAQMRRATPKSGLLSSDGAPPPPYAFEFPSLYEDMEGDVSDPVAATAKMMGIELDTALDMPPVTEEDVSNKSKAELTDLFLQAEKIIKARELELNVAANLGKTLLETNEALKLRHDALLSRLPAMQSPTKTPGVNRPRADTLTTDDEVPSPSATVTRAPSRANSISSNTYGSPLHSRSNSIIASSPRLGHVRRISASPSALHALSETNAELIAELTRLHNTTDVAQVEGAQRLRKLEREIGGLKAELEETQRTNAELEEMVKEKVDEARKREREERLRRLRGGGDNHDSDSASENAIPDFAPQGSGVEKWDSVPVTPRIKRDPSPDPPDSSAEQSDGEARSISASSIRSSQPASQYSTTYPGERGVVAQLYRKVVELQEANSELTARNRVTKKQLARAEREALSIKNLYDAIAQELADDQSEQGASTSTIRMKSRGTGSVGSKSNSWSFRMRGDSPLDGKRRVKNGSCSSLGSMVLHHGVRTTRNRPPLTDAMFSPPASTSPKKMNKTPPSVILFPSSPHTRLKPKVKGKAKPQTNPMPLLSPVASLALRRNVSGGSGSSVSSRTSAASSLLSTSFPRYGGRKRARRSLGSELGSEFGGDWDDVPSTHSSLFDDGSVRALSEAETETGAYADAEDMEDEDLALVALRDALMPPLAGRLLEQDEYILPVGSLQSSPGDVFHLVAHAVTARPTRWLDSDNRRVREADVPTAEDPWETTRYPDIEPGTEAEEERASIRMRRRERAIGRMVSTAHLRRVSNTLVPSASRLHVMEDNQPRGLLESFKRTSADMLIELWIFLQFVVVICTFLYTMSKRGPREVLGAPPRRA